jgi:pilus assembly protein Flp/PilA
MDRLLIQVSLFVKRLIPEDQGQDLVEYALVVALIGFAAITGMKFLSTGLNHAFSSISVTLTSNIS